MSAHEHPGEAHRGSVLARLTWLCAGVLGANDGIVSTAGLVVGVAGATSARGPVLLAGVAGVVAGALSMAGGEYVSVSTQRDTERAVLARERWELEHLPDEELAELAQMYADRGLPGPLAHQVARALTDHDALAAHAAVELGIDPDERSDPWRAAWSSMTASAAGALLPLLAVLLPPLTWRVPVTAAAVLLALALTGWASARTGGAPARPAVLRTVGVGAAAMAVTWTTGALVGAQIG
ncbi:VIT1/CCC1 transporter family protein [Quadrisphaera sp. DSM 44207]|uniref:VIT1/CCC1 transporter family protein n=1 Tax=Quadrisphaera sp. DSM 44207 TaxID=1881057 RepID=UPI000885B705|nr:VIT1/CCC1 transporter family protein [Quadrisphaera sp. DSM 44207]SDQ33602.1 Predicted Fe2+/Mn2+ transporter, VIT1/CCC1 family [Quadrisphaera sp. DSM 44207]